MEIKVSCYLANENNVDHVLQIKDSELKGKDDNQTVDYIFDNYVMPYVNAHMVVSYDVSQSFPDLPEAADIN